MAAPGVVAVAGEALVDLVPDAEGRLTPLLGGGPFNTARALGRLGQPTAFIGRVSHDQFGRRLAAALAEDGVALHESLRTDRPTSLAMVELDARGAASYSFYFQGTSAETLEPATALAAVPPGVAAAHVGGLGLILEPLATAVEALVAELQGRALVFVDPNVRPALIRDRAAYFKRLDRIMAVADVVKVSDEDLRWLAPGCAAEDAARDLLGRGPRVVLLTLGADGAVAFGAFGRCAATAPAVAVVDTIGAGDTFSGAWLARFLELGRPLADGEGVREATTFASRAAALSCTRPGASPPRRDEL